MLASDVTGNVSVVRNTEIANYYFNLGLKLRALELVEDSLRVTPAYTPLWLLKAKIHASLLDYAAAEEALSICIASDSTLQEAHLLNIQMNLQRSDRPEGEIQDKTSQAIRLAGEATFTRILSDVLLADPGFVITLPRLLAAWREAGDEVAWARDIMTAYERQDFPAALDILRRKEADPQADPRLLARLDFLLGRIMRATGHDSIARERLEKAGSLGFPVDEVSSSLALVHFGQGRFAEGADSLETVWRHSENPLAVLVKIADARLRSGGATRLLPLLDYALQSFPNASVLLGWRLAALSQVDPGAAEAYLAELVRRGATNGLLYGQILIARRQGDFARAREELAGIAQHVLDTQGFELPLHQVENWLITAEQSRLEQWKTETSLDRAADKLRQSGRNSDLAWIWEEQLQYRYAGDYRQMLEFIQDLVENGNVPLALDFAKRNLPDISVLGVALSRIDPVTFSNPRWDIVARILDEAGPLGNGSWPALFQAVGDIISTNTEHLTEAVEKLSRLPPETQALTLNYIDADGIPARLSIPGREFRRFLQELGELLLQGRFTEVFPLLIGSPQWDAPDATGQPVLNPGRLAEVILSSSEDKNETKELLSRLLAVDPENSQVNLAMATLGQQIGDPRLIERHLAAGLVKAEGGLRERLLALRAELAGNSQQQAEHLLNYISGNLGDNTVRLGLIRALVRANRFSEAKEQVAYLERQFQQGDTLVEFYLAMAYGDIGDYFNAEKIWRQLSRRYSHSQAALAGLGLTLNLQGKMRESLSILSGPVRLTGNGELAALAGEAALALSDFKGAMIMVDLGLAKEPDNFRLLQLGTQAAEALADPESLEKYSRAALEIRPYSIAMNTMFGQALASQEKWEEVEKHDQRLFELNPLNQSARERESERLIAIKAKPKEVWQNDHQLAVDFGTDPLLWIRAAISAASAGKFANAFALFNKMAIDAPNATVVTLAFDNLSLSPTPGVLSLADFEQHLRRLLQSMRFAGAENYGARAAREISAGKIPLQVVIGRTHPETLLALDDLLASLNGQAFLVVGGESLVEDTPLWPDAKLLQRLAETGRWGFLLTDYSPPELPGPTPEEPTSYWTQPNWLGERFETREEMHARLSQRLADLKAAAAKIAVDIKGWVYPSWGDYGQRTVKNTREAMSTVRQAVADNFPFALTRNPSGMWVPWSTSDPLRIPMRTVFAAIAPDDLAKAIMQNIPPRRAILELAKVKSWNGQLPAADRLFRRARELSLDRAETVYFHARNSQYEGDIPQAVEMTDDLWALEPPLPANSEVEDPFARNRERNATLLEDVNRLQRPLLRASPRWWEDDGGESYVGYSTRFSFHVNPRLELRFQGGQHSWRDTEGKTAGWEAGFGARYYFKRENWLSLDLKNVRAAKLQDQWEMAAAWHGAFSLAPFGTNGTFDLQYFHEGVESRPARLAEIMTDRLSLASNFRTGNRWETDAEIFQIFRTDNNQTRGINLRPTYRLFEMPLLRLGYWFNQADSDRDPEEYYAPLGYQAHQAVVIYRQNIGKQLVVNGLFSIGKAKTQTKDWSTVLRWTAGVQWKPNEIVDLGLNYSHLKLPDYELKAWGFEGGVRF
jgi:Tfp pilus assembly protein PilF